MPPMRLNEANPLTRFKRSNPYLQWDQLEKKAGLSKVTLIHIAQKNREQILKLSLETFLKIKDRLKIDLLDDSQWGEEIDFDKINEEYLKS